MAYTYLQELALKNGTAIRASDHKKKVGDAKCSTQMPVGLMPTETKEQMRNAESDVQSVSTSAKKAAARKKRWQQKNKRKLADYQKEYRAKNK